MAQQFSDVDASEWPRWNDLDTTSIILFERALPDDANPSNRALKTLQQHTYEPRARSRRAELGRMRTREYGRAKERHRQLETIDFDTGQTVDREWLVSNLWDERDDDDSPICPTCGVSALPPEVPGEPSSCENADCDAFGEPVE